MFVTKYFSHENGNGKRTVYIITISDNLLYAGVFFNYNTHFKYHLSKI